MGNGMADNDTGGGSMVAEAVKDQVEHAGDGRQSPLFFSSFTACEQNPSGAGSVSWGVHMTERRHQAMINLRGGTADDGFVEALAAGCGVTLPLQANTTASANDMLACWMAPDEWLLLGPPGSAGQWVQRLSEHLSGQHFAATDVSSGHTIIRLRGAEAATVLAKSCSLDLHPAVFMLGQCAQTFLAKAQVLIVRHSDAFDVIVRRSFAEYLWLWLSDAAGEYGLCRDVEMATAF